MELHYDVSQSDLAAFNWHHFTTAPGPLAQRASSRRISAASFSFLAFLVIGLHDPIQGLVAAVFVGVAMWILVPPLAIWFARRTFRRAAEQNALGTSSSHSLLADDRGLTDVTSEGETVVYWSAIKKVEETAEHAFIFFSPVQAFVIPKRIGGPDVLAFLEEVRARSGVGSSSSA